jgi:hypothetical protein
MAKIGVFQILLTPLKFGIALLSWLTKDLLSISK